MYFLHDRIELSLPNQKVAAIGISIAVGIASSIRVIRHLPDLEIS
jgi:hypothetical protein